MREFDKNVMEPGDDYFFPVRDEANVRVEELPSGTKVFYIHVGNVPNSEVKAFLEKVKNDLKKKKEPTKGIQSSFCGNDRDLGFECNRFSNHSGPCHDARYVKPEPFKLCNLTEMKPEDLDGLPFKTCSDPYDDSSDPELGTKSTHENGQPIIFGEDGWEFEEDETEGCDLGQALQDIDDEYADKIRAVNREKWIKKCNKDKLEKEIRRRTKRTVKVKKSRVRPWHLVVATLSALSGIAAAILLL